ncbi:1-aminocyclopropane-1-carboxylate deaminase/D-cysteine desulfhydrase [Parashewanella spongiae]|uniref:1-aminocyclopropane-1-carboxylate deaminase/D-cysteine desulfhydrase n=1 Tax=Parashewanella spongiae TaxID=342950 RepID=A0A3A6U0L3_9GAMM|nr:1-aminocyclopropane-1-carboxylate deaminase/D-cysteine desulfhydrase [Parashewanella spongiae]MCL1078570.1 1-aminocyclopropane-1-carboxylate deaminase/D-cysteine desulfhydrase [Parashewanella spongiae]RJY19027.1 1-aminocyclopropane-1-carboxylate deaminase/D-cysteine desulfhydrase [Parashewanella spongiae]
MKLTHSPVDEMQFSETKIFVKRDDLLHPEFSGNKARKFKYFLDSDLSGITKLIGYGSCQANSLYSLSCLAKLKEIQLDFYVDKIPEYLKENPAGNFSASLKNGANILEVDSEKVKQKGGKLEWLEFINHGYEDQILIPEGGRCEYAKHGIYELAQEIVEWRNNSNIGGLHVFLPSGTGTTALFLQQYFVDLGCDIQVYTCAVVGGESYLLQQFEQLTNDTRYFPKILSVGKKYHFGKLYLNFYSMWQKICEAGIEFELIYDPLGFITIEKHIEELSSCTLMYIHQGGLKGNETMLPRYCRKFDLR